jgi:hypothetical protein
MKFSPATGEADLRSILTHEIGHCLGLDHPIEPPDYTSVDTFLTEATMVQTASTGLDPSDSGRRTINQDDRDGIECLYERGKPFRNGIHCGSYSGTNGQGALSGTVSGGPTAIDEICGGNAQGRNAHAALESGDGCVASAIASSGEESPVQRAIFTKLGWSFGFLIFCGVYFLLRRRSLRRILGLFLAFLFTPQNAHSIEVELTYGVRDLNPQTWNSFAGMDPQASSWDKSIFSCDGGRFVESSDFFRHFYSLLRTLIRSKSN